jgi:hypothetical protein
VGLAGRDFLTVAQGSKQFVSFGFRIKTHHNKIPFFKVAVFHSISLLYRVLVANTIQFGPSIAKIKCFGNLTKTSKPFAKLWRCVCVAGKFLLQVSNQRRLP